MGRGRGRARNEPEAALAGKRTTSGFDAAQEPQSTAAPAAPDGATSAMETYLRQVERLGEMRREVAQATPLLLRRGFDELFAAHPDLVGIGWTDEPNPYYDENCYVQMGDRYMGGGLVVQDDDSLTLDQNGYVQQASHAAAPKVKELLQALDMQTMDDIFGSDGVAVCYTRAGRILWDFEGTAQEGESDPDFRAINELVNAR